jgi:outer membrane protein OmpA-like peptidoglycan-associated protein
MLFRSSERTEDYWITVSDLMAGLMVIFLFIAIAYMIKVQKQYDAFVYLRKEYIEAQEAIAKKLETEFEKDLRIWDAEIDKKTLSVIFLEPDVMFDKNEARIKTRFKEILKDFFPRYIDALTTAKFTFGDSTYLAKDKIAKIRIEGHSSPEWKMNTPERLAFQNNMDLSQRRASSVLRYSLDKIKGADYDWIKRHILAVGYSSSEAKYDFSTNQIDNEASRRVEFRVVMDAQQLLYEIISGELPEDHNLIKITDRDREEALKLLQGRQLKLRK